MRVSATVILMSLAGIFAPTLAFASGGFQIEHVRGIYSFRKNARTPIVQKSSSQRQLGVGTILALQEGSFDESQAELTQAGVRISLLGGSTVELAGPRMLRRWAGPLRIRVLPHSKSFSVKLVGPRVAEPLTAQCVDATGCDWLVFDRPVEPQAGRGAQDPETVVVVLRGRLQLTRFQRGTRLPGADRAAVGGRVAPQSHLQSIETLSLQSRDHYAHSLYSGGDFSPRSLIPGEAEAIYRQFGWEP